MEFYCESCETAMCLECTEGEHREHVTVPLKDVLEQHKTALSNQLDTVRNRYNVTHHRFVVIVLYINKANLIFVFIHLGRLPQLTAAIELVNEISKQLSERKNDAVTDISNTFDELEKALHLRKTALVTEVENICSTKQKVRLVSKVLNVESEHELCFSSSTSHCLLLVSLVHRRCFRCS